MQVLFGGGLEGSCLQLLRGVAGVTVEGPFGTRRLGGRALS